MVLLMHPSPCREPSFVDILFSSLLDILQKYIFIDNAGVNCLIVFILLTVKCLFYVQCHLDNLKQAPILVKLTGLDSTNEKLFCFGAVEGMCQ